MVACVLAAALAWPAGRAVADPVTTTAAQLQGLMAGYRTASIAADDAAYRSFRLRLEAESARAAATESENALDDAARAAYIGGAWRTIEAVLGSASLADLEARLPYARRAIDDARRNAAAVTSQRAALERAVQDAYRAEATALSNERVAGALRDQIASKLATLRAQAASAPTNRDAHYDALFREWLATQDAVTRALAERRRSRGEADYHEAAAYLGPRPDCTAPPGLHATGAALSGDASWYGPGFDGNATASGAVYDPMRYTVAHKTLPLGVFLLIRFGDRCVLSYLNDRGPYAGDRILDLSQGSAQAVGLTGVQSVDARVYVR